MIRFRAIAALWIVSALLAGCAGLTHPAAGTWTNDGLVKTTVVLNSDGTGNYSLPVGGGQSIKWTERGNTVDVYKGDVADTSKATPLATGQLSDDRKTLNLNVSTPPVGLTLHRQDTSQS